MAAGDDSQEKFGKENQLLDGKLSDGTATLAEEEEKAKHLLKLKAKHESTIDELEDKLRKDNQQKQEEERSERKIETELDDMKEQVGEKKQQVEEMQLLLGKREERAYTLDVVKQIKKAGCNVLLIQESILRNGLPDLAVHFFDKMKTRGSATPSTCSGR